MYICQLNDITDGESLGFDPEDIGHDSIFIIRKGNKVFGYKNACPHYGSTPLAWRKNEYLNGDKTQIMCSAHGALFTINKGECTQGACLGQKLIAIKLTISKTGGIHLSTT